jgi:hypothetical protein
MPIFSAMTFKTSTRRKGTNAVFRAPGGTKYTVWFTSHREKHERRLSAVGLTGVAANAFSVNTELSVLTIGWDPTQ